MRIGHQRRVGVFQRRAQFLDFRARALAGIAGRVDRDGASRLRRAIGPKRIDWIGVERHEFDFLFRKRLGEAFDLRAGVHPRVVADARARTRMFADPFRGRYVGDVERLEQPGVDLAAHLDDIAAVDENRGLFLQHDGKARRAGEAGEPGEAFRAFGHIFVLMRVGARNEETVEALALEFGAQRLEPRGAVAARGVVGEGLEFRFEHNVKLVARAPRGNAFAPSTSPSQPSPLPREREWVAPLSMISRNGAVRSLSRIARGRDPAGR